MSRKQSFNGQAFKRIREERKYSYSDIKKEAYKDLGYNIKEETLKKYENGDTEPHVKTASIFAKILNVPVGAFYNEDIVSGNKEYNPVLKEGFIVNNEKLLIYGGEPVFVISKRSKGHGEWALVDDINGVLRFSDGSIKYINEEFSKIYHCPSPLSEGIEPSNPPIAESQLRRYQKLWIEVLYVNRNIRHRLSSWGIYNPEKDGYINESKILFPRAEYGKTWVAFEQQIDFERIETIRTM